MGLYLVGGTVRDLLCGKTPRDLDLAVEGDAVALGRGWAHRTGQPEGEVSEFGTAAFAAIAGRRPVRVDFAGCRRELYEAPASLPRVFPAGIGEDLARRDFTVNAMALPLGAPDRDGLLDPFDGRRDLSRRILRLLHPRSAHDDPTRAFRALRYSGRLGFAISPETRRWIREAMRAGAFARLSGDRLRRELDLLFGELKPSEAARGLRTLGLDEAIARNLPGGSETRKRLERLEALARGGSAGLQRSCAALLAWCLGGGEACCGAVCDRLMLHGEQARRFRQAGRLREEVSGLMASGAALSRLSRATRTWPDEVVLAVACSLSPKPARRLLLARRRGSRIKLSISGEDLKRAGILPGPAIGRALDRTWGARVDGALRRADELAFALSEARR